MEGVFFVGFGGCVFVAATAAVAGVEVEEKKTHLFSKMPSTLAITPIKRALWLNFRVAAKLKTLLLLWQKKKRRTSVRSGTPSDGKIHFLQGLAAEKEKKSGGVFLSLDHFFFSLTPPSKNTRERRKKKQNTRSLCVPFSSMLHA